MPDLRDYPALGLCYDCKQFFTSPNAVGNTPRDHRIFHSREGYKFRRLRRDFEASFILGCTFCQLFAIEDASYRPSLDSRRTDLGFVQPRPASYPPLDEEVAFNVHYHGPANLLKISAWKGLQCYEGFSFSLYTTSGDPASSLLDMKRGQATLTDVGSPSTLASMGSFMKDCLAGHDKCPKQNHVKLPTRLVEVSSPGVPESAHISEMKGQIGTYLALSYCWGADQPFKNTEKRLSEYSKQLPYSDLPKTIIDAFRVTRSLGERYIWVDSLCIIQDNDADKEKELADMFNIYRNAQLVISAANSQTCNDGFLVSRYGNVQGLFHVPVRVDKNSSGSVLLSKESCWISAHTSRQPINERAWTLQECLLASRLLIFGSSEVYWRCQSMFQPASSIEADDEHDNDEEQSKQEIWRQWSLRSGYASYTLKDFAREASSPKGQIQDSKNARSIWRAILTNYTQRKLSDDGDKLPAISAIAEFFQSQFQTDYLAGLWRSQLIHELLWSTDPFGRDFSGKRTKKWPDVPTWSWVSVDSAICTDLCDPVHRSAVTATIRHCSIQLHLQDALYGAVVAGELTVEGFVKEILLEPRLPGSTMANKVYDPDDNNMEIAAIRWDIADIRPRMISNSGEATPQAPNQLVQAWYLVLEYFVYSTDNRTATRGLALVRHPTQLSRYQRVGVCYGASESELEDKPWKQCKTLEVTII